MFSFILDSLSMSAVSPNMMTVAYYVLPSVLGYLIMATLAITPQTHMLRIALWPLIAFISLRAAVSIDMSSGYPDRRFYSTLFKSLMILIITRTFDWMSKKEPLVRQKPVAKGSRSTITDALDLASTFRGYGWDWAREVYFPRETRPTDRTGFVLHTILSAAVHTFLCGVLHITIRSFSPMGHGTLSGGPIFDDTLPLHIGCIRTTIVSTCILLELYAFIQMCYDASTILAVLVLGHDPEHWPPAFDAPWRATSLADFWGRRWHQFFRHTFLVQGGYPLSWLLGRPGYVIGTFLSSGAIHHVCALPLNDQLEPWRMIVGFEMMALGILMEATFRRWTKRKVRGTLGWFWTMTWLAVWGSLIADGLARAGTFGGHLGFTEWVVPPEACAGVERFVARFDAWLRSAM